ncbi:Uncharacterised protein [Klebsiella michiganensis]|uniref:Uncharacterized protein n=1 Tax=Klebsiella michiganensis TaxID=1134687 RepID=A0A7H4PG11_9ENTR|nr:Uncharacterised protein [Klebsiella michiganensis]
MGEVAAASLSVRLNSSFFAFKSCPEKYERVCQKRAEKRLILRNDMMFIYFGELLYGYIAFEMVDQPGIVAIIWIYMLFAAGGGNKNARVGGALVISEMKITSCLLFVFFVAQRDNQHIHVNGVDELTSRGHQFAPEVLMVTANHEVHIILFNRINQHLAEIAAAAQGLSDRIAPRWWTARLTRGESLRRCVSACRPD